MSDDFKIYLAQPAYGGGRPESHKAFWTTAATSRYNGKILAVHGGGSLLANGFNQFWIHALNLQAAGEPVRYFAMLHDDIEPQEGWLDMLIEDLEKHDADLISVVMPIKDPLGLSSTAIDNPRDLFVVERRLTIQETDRLPEVFSAADCGYPTRHLLANTGCWVCRFDRPWRHATDESGELKVFFTIGDRIRKSPVTGQWVAEVASEDWNFSRMLQAEGGKVLCSRRVKCKHWGTVPYPNHGAWGTWEYDKILGDSFDHKPILPDPSGKPCDALLVRDYNWSDEFPDVPGWMTDIEGRALAKWGKGKRVLEIGAYLGRSALWFAKTARWVDVVDTFDGRGVLRTSRDLEPDFIRNMRRHEAHVVTHWRGTSEAVIPSFTSKYDLCFIDGAHDLASVEKDIELCLSVLKPDGLLAFHDYSNGADPDVKKAVDALVSAGAEIIDRAGSLALVRPKRISDGEDHDNRAAYSSYTVTNAAEPTFSGLVGADALA